MHENLHHSLHNKIKQAKTNNFFEVAQLSSDIKTTRCLWNLLIQLRNKERERVFRD